MTKFFGDVFMYMFREPREFKTEPYQYLTNQLGHMVLGFMLTTFLIWGIYKAVGSYPNQALFAAGVVVAYLFFWEILKQGWRGFDSIEDAYYVGYGASVFLFIDMSGEAAMPVTINFLAYWCAGAIPPLFGGVIVRYIRMKRKIDEENND